MDAQHSFKVVFARKYMSELKLLFYKIKWALSNFPETWKSLPRVNQLALILIPLGLTMSILRVPLSDLVIGISLGIFVTQYLQRMDREER
jgi:hypothetical protein